MADVRWTRLDSDWDRIVVLLANALDAGNLLDRLVSRKCISHSQQEKIRRRLLNSEVKLDDVARDLLIVLRLRPPPSFDSFSAVLKQGNDDDKALYDCIASTGAGAAEGDESPERAPRENLPDSQLQDSPPPAAPSAFPGLLFIHVHENIKSKWECNRESFISIVKTYCIHALPGKKISVHCDYFPRMTLMPERNSDSYVPIFEEECLLRIIFPKTKPEVFEECRIELLGAMSNLVPIKKIEIKSGCCIVDLTLTGKGFINFVCGLHASTNFAHLLIFDPLAKLQIGSLPPVELVTFLFSGQLQSVSEAFSVCRKV